jgi:hypothetical protein
MEGPLKFDGSLQMVLTALCMADGLNALAWFACLLLSL